MVQDASVAIWALIFAVQLTRISMSCMTAVKSYTGSYLGYLFVLEMVCAYSSRA